MYVCHMYAGLQIRKSCFQVDRGGGGAPSHPKALYVCHMYPGLQIFPLLTGHWYQVKEI